MFDVCDKETGKMCVVYHVVQSKGYPHFLIYDDGKWIYKSAKHFKPCELYVGFDENIWETSAGGQT